MSFGLGSLFVAVNTAAQAGVPADKAGLAAALINTSTWLGAALGVAIFEAISTSRARDLLDRHTSLHVALTSGFSRALLTASVFMLAAALIGTRATNTRGEPQVDPAAVVAPEPA